MDGSRIHVDRIVNIVILSLRKPDAATTPENVASKWKCVEDSCRTRDCSELSSSSFKRNS
jgi:hypothetical protein